MFYTSFFYFAPMDINQISDKVKRAVTMVGNYIRSESKILQRDAFEVKALNSLVTHVDKSAEEQLVQALKEILPEAGFLTEEKTVEQNEQSFTWIIDPIDGTTNFIHQLPFYCISVALKYEYDIILGIVFEINRKEMFSALKGEGAFLNDRSIQVSKATHLKDTVLATGFPYYDYVHLDPYLHVFEYFVKHTRGLRRFGSAALDLAYTACGRFDGYYEYGLMHGILLLEHYLSKKLEE